MSTSTLATPTVVGRPLPAAIRTAAIALAIVLFAVLSFAVGHSTVSTHRAPAFHRWTSTRLSAENRRAIFPRAKP